MLPRILFRLAVFTAVAAAETFANVRGLIPFELPWSVTAVMGSAVGLLLAFRTNSGYERFWEARTAWGAIVNRTRNLARQAHALFHAETTREVILLTLAFTHGAKHHFARSKSTPEVEALLGTERTRELHLAPGMPQRALLALSTLFARARREGTIDSIDQQRLEADVAVLIDQFGICQRIRSTPLPAAYVIQLRTALSFLLVSVPLAVGANFGWFAPFLVFVIAYVFLGMAQIGTELEDPFERTRNDVNLEAISGTIQDDLLALCDMPSDMGKLRDARQAS